MQEPKTEAEVILDAGIAIAQSAASNADVDALLIPERFRVEDLERFRATPRRTRQRVAAETLESFLSYYDRYATDRSVIFVDRAVGRVTAVLDYHDPNDPQWGDHVLAYEMPHSNEWKTWKAKSGAQMRQADFAEFIEENLLDIVEPDGASMLEVARNLQAKKKVNFASAINTANGDVQFTYETETHAKGTIDVPQTFAIGITPFQGGEGYRIEARLRYRISDEGQLTMWYSLIRPDKVRENAIDDVVAVLKERTPAERVWMGKAS